ncbi:LysR family transcriptional regulator [Robbsia sp. KACC 23696]|uniref:LysR family transcriptional regulator n=1 Tax=Robbsia sp. KACC 23696 TaxID=3149231 RepID=UPI00325C32A0
MNDHQPGIDDLRIFALVSRLSSFTAAALQLSVPRSTASTAVKRLEDQLGVRLLQRTTRRVVLTHEGQALLERSERLLEDFGELATMFHTGTTGLSGRLSVALPLGMATGIIMTALPTFTASHPALEIDIHSADRRVDVVADGYDCVVRVGRIVDESVACRPLGQLALINVASSGYIARHGKPDDVDALAHHSLVNYRPNPTDPPDEFVYQDAERTVRVPMRHRVTVDNSAAYNAACRAGYGITQTPYISAAADLKSGVLVEILPGYRAQPMPIYLLYPHRRNLPPRVRLFGDWLSEVVRTQMSA